MTLIELLIALAILGVILAALTGLFVSGLRSEVDQSRRVEAQQEARLGLDQLRREMRCAKAIVPAVAGPWPASKVALTLGAYCPTNKTAGEITVTYCTEQVGGVQRWRLKRYVGTPANCTVSGGRTLADYITKGVDGAIPIVGGEIFRAYDKVVDERGSVRLAIPVNVTPANATQWCGNGLGRCMTLRAEVVLRNTPRT